MALEQDVNLTVRSTLHLRQEEIGHDETEETSSSPDVTTFSAKVGLLQVVSSCLQYIWGKSDSYISIEHVTCEEDARNVHDVV
jgi:hypothetical protein